jgi:hypothetical protein
MVLHNRSGTSRTNHPIANLLEQLESRTLLSTVVFPSATVTTGQMVAIADFNGDGLADIASSGTVDSLSVYASVKFGMIGGGFTPSTVLEAAPPGSLFGGMPLLAADFDGNGTIDLLAGNARLYLGIGDGTFGAAVSVNVPGSSAASRLLDSDLDGQAEIISKDLTGAINIYRFQGTDFIAVYTLTTTPGTFVVDVAEIDGNPGLDILTLDAAGIYIPFLRTSATSYAAGPSFQNGSMFAAIGSLDSDAFPDLYFIAPNQIEPYLFVARGTGAGAFAPATNTGIPASRVHMVNDLDGDGRSEIVVSDPGISSTEYVYYAGGTDQPSPQSAEVLVDANQLRSVRYVAFGRLGGDSRIDLLVGVGPLNPSLPPTTAQIWTAADAPSAAEIVLPSSPVIPGQLFSITASSVSFPQAGSQLRRVQFTFDLNADGVAQTNEPTFAAQSVGESDWTASILATDGLISCGDFRIVASISDRYTRGTVSSSNSVAVWYRVYYAEGWRNDESVTEFVPLVNPNDVPVEYRIYAQYEVGERDQLIASGTIAPHSRGGVTISERFRPQVALVRANEGYALEVQSSLAIGAFISHYDDWAEFLARVQPSARR